MLPMRAVCDLCQMLRDISAMQTPRKHLVTQAVVRLSARKSRTHSAIYLGTSFPPSLRPRILSIATAMPPVCLLDKTKNLYQSEPPHCVRDSLIPADFLNALRLSERNPQGAERALSPLAPLRFALEFRSAGLSFSCNMDHRARNPIFNP